MYDLRSAASAQVSPETAQIVTDVILSLITDIHESFVKSEHFAAAQALLDQVQPISHNSLIFLAEHDDTSFAVQAPLE